MVNFYSLYCVCHCLLTLYYLLIFSFIIIFGIELFRTTMHQDAHEFLNYTLNAIAENVMEQQKKMEELEKQREQEQRCDISEKSKSSVNGTSINESEESGASGNYYR
jgi:uncharacterized UBP type Zn finger protein